MPEAFDWNEIEAAVRRLGDGSLQVDRKWLEQRSAEVASGRLSASANRLPTMPEPAGPADVDSLAALPPERRRELAALGQRLLDEGKVAAAVLNGGMATRFGGGVKGVVTALGGRSFLELKLRQALRAGVRSFLIMNSFATHGATRALLEQLQLPGSRAGAGGVRCFLQSAALRFARDGGPFRDRAGALSFYAPGHGEFGAALANAGELERLARSGVEWITLSNVDNLGADVDPLILGYHASSGRSITCEVARALPGDKGGSPARVGGSLQVVEGFRFPEQFDFGRLFYLSTNTFVFSLRALQAGTPFDWYYVEKEVDGRPAVQIECIVCDLTQHFPTNYLDVPRGGAQGRFFPVKTPQDLEAMRSDPELVRRFSE